MNRFERDCTRQLTLEDTAIDPSEHSHAPCLLSASAACFFELSSTKLHSETENSTHKSPVPCQYPTYNPRYRLGTHLTRSRLVHLQMLKMTAARFELRAPTSHARPAPRVATRTGCASGCASCAPPPRRSPGCATAPSSRRPPHPAPAHTNPVTLRYSSSGQDHLNECFFAEEV